MGEIISPSHFGLPGSGGKPIRPLSSSNNIVPILAGMIELRGYVDEPGNKRFAEWL
jgi:hypothetical protein